MDLQSAAAWDQQWGTESERSLDLVLDLVMDLQLATEWVLQQGIG